MKTWKRALALTMALGMTFSIVACGDDDDSSSSSSGGGNPNPPTQSSTPTTEAEIYDYVVDALAATKAYNGSATLNIVSQELDKETEGSETETSEYYRANIMSFNTANGMLYNEYTHRSPYGGETSVGKTFVQNDNFYVYMKQTQTPPQGQGEPQEMELYAQYVGAAKEDLQGQANFASYVEYFEYSGAVLEVASNFNELKTGVQTAFPVVASVNFEVENPTTTTEVKATANNGVYTVSVKMNATNEGSTATFESSISAKDGKIINAMQKQAYGGEYTEGEGAEAVTCAYEETSVEEISISYAFDQAKYDALSVQLPTNPDEIEVEGGEQDYDDLYVELYVNGQYYKNGSAWEAETAAEAFAQMTGDVNYGDNATVDWYKDEACTQQVTADTVTDAELFAMEVLYAKVTPATGYALVTEYQAERYELSKPYEIVYTLIEGALALDEDIWGASSDVVEAGEVQLDEWYAQEYTVYINGQKQAAGTLTFQATAGQVYVIEYVDIEIDPVPYTESEAE